MSVHRGTHITTVSTSTSVDWAATGAFLSGIGTIIVAIAVIVATVIGGHAFRAWKRQQLVQRQMDHADKILTLVIRAKDEIETIRSPFKSAAEVAEAVKSLEANGFDKADHTGDVWNRLASAQATHARVNRFHTTWADLQAAKPSAFVYFSEKLAANIETILRQVYAIRIDADAYAAGDGDDAQFGRKMINTLSRGRPKGEKDELGETVDTAVKAIEAELQPMIRNAASVTQAQLTEPVRDGMLAALRQSIRLARPW